MWYYLNNNRDVIISVQFQWLEQQDDLRRKKKLEPNTYIFISCYNDNDEEFPICVISLVQSGWRTELFMRSTIIHFNWVILVLSSESLRCKFFMWHEQRVRASYYIVIASSSIETLPLNVKNNKFNLFILQQLFFTAKNSLHQTEMHNIISARTVRLATLLS